MRALLILLCSLLAAAPASAVEPPVILVFGDSLSAGYGLAPGQGWVALLQQRLKSQGYGHRVVNASVSGETTDGGVERMDRALATHRPAVVIVGLGGNDGLRGLPVARMRANLDLLIVKSRAAGAEVLLLEVRVPTNYGPQYGSSFRQAYRDLAAKHRVGLAPFVATDRLVTREMFQDDGIHPNAGAQPILLDSVWPLLSPLLRR